jgi:hypothetical protein
MRRGFLRPRDAHDFEEAGLRFDRGKYATLNPIALSPRSETRRETPASNGLPFFALLRRHATAKILFTMSEVSSNTGFTVWAADRTPQGPMDLLKVISWVKSERIVAGTWIFDSRNATWERAANVPELQMYFQAWAHLPPAHVEAVGAAGAIDIRALRRVKLLSYFTDEQLERFTQFVVAEQMPPQAVIVKQGDCGNAMYVILEGELSVRMNVGGLETELATLGMGDFFGDIGLFDHGPRSASVVVRTSCLLLKISVEAFERLSQDATDLATPFLRAIAKTLAARIRTANKHRGETVKFSHALE